MCEGLFPHVTLETLGLGQVGAPSATRRSRQEGQAGPGGGRLRWVPRLLLSRA